MLILGWVSEYAAMAVTILVFVIGFFGGILPVIPGTLVVWAGILLHRLWMGEASVSWEVVAMTFGLMLISQVVDFLLTLWGAKVFGATWKGMVGAIIGGIVGMVFFNLPGIILGPIVGAIAGELLTGRKWSEAQRAGVGTIAGGIAAMVTKQIIAFIMIMVFFFSLPPT